MRRRITALIGLAVLLVLAACNLQVVTVPDPTAFPTPQPLDAANGNVQINFVTATPFGNPAPDGGMTVATPDPGVPTASGNAIDWLINTIILPAWNFLYTFVMDALASTWNFAGARGGLFAQVLCCVVPFVLGVILLVTRVARGRRVI